MLIDYWKKIFDYKSNTSRTEYWICFTFYTFIFIFLFLGIAKIFPNLFYNNKTKHATVAYLIIMLTLALPNFSMFVRRAKDAGLPRWLPLILLIPSFFSKLVQIIIVLFFGIKSSKSNEQNKIKSYNNDDHEPNIILS